MSDSVGLFPHLGTLTHPAVRFQDQQTYIATVLTGTPITHPKARAVSEDTTVTMTDLITGTGTALVSAALALVSLYWRRFPLLRHSFERRSFETPLRGPIQRFQSGVVNDYITWMIIGLVCLGASLALSIR